MGLGSVVVMTCSLHRYRYETTRLLVCPIAGSTSSHFGAEYNSSSSSGLTHFFTIGVTSAEPEAAPKIAEMIWISSLRNPGDGTLIVAFVKSALLTLMSAQESCGTVAPANVSM